MGSFPSPFSGGRYGYATNSGYVNLGGRGYGNQNPNAFAVYDFSLGLNIKKTPQQLDDRELTVALNVYLRAEGGVEMRKGIATRGSQFTSTPGKGIVRFFQQVVGGAAQATPVKFLLAQAGGNLYNVDTGAQIGAANALGANAKPWCTARVFDPDLAAGATDVLVICTGDGGPYLFDGTSITVPAGWSSAAGARWCCVLNGILWFGGIPTQPNLLLGSRVGHPETLPFYSSFALSGPITGMVPSGQGPQAGVVVGLNNGLAVLYGTGRSNFYLQDVPMTDGVVAGRTMIAVNGIVYFLGRNAIYAFDGQNVTPISDQVEPWILNDPLAADFPMNGDRSTAFAWWENNKIFFAYDSGNVGYPTTYLTYHPTVNGGWTVQNGPKLIAACTLDAPGDGVTGNPAQVVVLDATKGQAYNWDVYNGAGANGTNVDDAGVAITASALSKYYKVGEPGTTKRIMRAYPEIFVQQFGGSFVVQTDYSSSSYSALLTAQAQASGVFDSSPWDGATWGGAGLVYDKQRVDLDVEAEAFAFGIFTNDTNPPWRFVGLSGVFAQESRN